MFNLLQKNKKIKSQTCVQLKYKITISQKEIEQIQYLTQNYVYTESGNRKVIYLPKKDKQYLIDIEKQQMKELDLSAQIMQLNQIKAMIGELTINEQMESEIRNISITNSSESQAKLEVNLQILKFSDLAKTVFPKFSEYQQTMQMFRLDLNDDEIVKFSESIFSFNGQEQKVVLELNSNNSDLEEIDSFCNYKIIK